MDLELRKRTDGRVREEIQAGFWRSREVNSVDIFYVPLLDWVSFYLFCMIF